MINITSGKIVNIGIRFQDYVNLQFVKCLKHPETWLWC